MQPYAGAELNESRGKGIETLLSKDTSPASSNTVFCRTWHTVAEIRAGMGMGEMARPRQALYFFAMPALDLCQLEVPSDQGRWRRQRVRSSTFLEADKYSAIETLRDGGRVEIRALTPDDRGDLLTAVARISAESLRRRFFVPKKNLTDRETAFFLNVDFINHVALVAVVEEGGGTVIVGGGRYIVVKPGEAEIAFAVVDDYQGRGIGSLLMRHVVAIARVAGIERLIAEVLAENLPMLRVFEQSSLPMSTKRDAELLYVTLQLS
jgi:GNAT superfamily N-acetyltransferase